MDIVTLSCLLNRLLHFSRISDCEIFLYVGKFSLSFTLVNPDKNDVITCVIKLLTEFPKIKQLFIFHFKLVVPTEFRRNLNFKVALIALNLAKTLFERGHLRAGALSRLVAVVQVSLHTIYSLMEIGFIPFPCS